MKNLTKKQLEAQIVELSIQQHWADQTVKRRREELNDEYAGYFQARGEIEPGFRGIRPDDHRYADVIAYTADTYGRLLDAKRARYNARRRLSKAVTRLIDLIGCKPEESVAVPIRRVPVEMGGRTTIYGETLQ